MAIYNLNYGKLESLLDRSFSPSTEHAIIEAIKSAGIITPHSGKTSVEVETTSGSYTIPRSTQVFLDTGSQNAITINDDGAKLIAAGDGSNRITDMSPGGDTLVGGAGAAWLKVSHGANVLIGGSGANTLIGGAGHDTLIGGGSSLLEAGSGGSTLTGGLGDQNSSGHGHAKHRGSASVPSDTLKGGQGNDLLQVSHGDNLLIAGGGHDTIFGGDGQDTIFGGGHDTISLNYGNEFVQGGSGSDIVNIGLHGNDVIYGGAATTIQTDQTSTSIKSEVEVHGVTTITFSNHQILTVSNVTIEFADGHKTTAH
jgi:Ca2+-binding RTX toxin-like protein